MSRLHRHARLAGVLAAGVAVVGGAVAAAFIVTRDEPTPAAPTTGLWAPITVVRPSVPIIGGGVPVDLEPVLERRDFSTTLAPLPGTHRYRLLIANASNLGVIHSFQWYPPTGVRIVELIGNTVGRCTIRGRSGFGGSQFPTVVLQPNILCDKLDLKPPSCTCLGDGGAVTISFATDNAIQGGDLDLRLRTATLAFDPVPTYLAPTSNTPSAG